MWRRYGDAVYALLVLGIFTVQALGLGFLTWVLIERRGGLVTATRVREATLGVAALVALMLMILMAYVLVYHATTSARDRFRRRGLDRWTDIWVAVLYQQAEPPAGSLDKEAVDALVDLGEHLKGAEADRLAELVEQYQIGERLVARARPLPLQPRRLDRFRRGVRRFVNNPRRLATRLEALEGMSKARIGRAVEPLLQLSFDPEPAIRAMAVRALARTVARTSASDPASWTVSAFVRVIRDAEVPRGIVEESLVVLEDAAPAVLRSLLHSDVEDPVVVTMSVEAVGKLCLVELASDVVPFAGHDDPEIRAAAIRAFSRMGFVPPEAQADVVAALVDDIEFVRGQAAHAAPYLDPSVAIPQLKILLGDPSWWVRRAAAQALLRMGTDGPRALHRAARKHADRYARHMAVQTLLDAGRLDPVDARRLKEAV